MKIIKTYATIPDAVQEHVREYEVLPVFVAYSSEVHKLLSQKPLEKTKH